MEDSIEKYADALYEQELHESARVLGDQKIALLHRIAARNPTSPLPFSGVDFQLVRTLYVEHVGRCLAARLDCYRKAYAAIGRSPTDQEFREIYASVANAQKVQVGNSTGSLSSFANSRGMPGNFGELLPHTAREFDRVVNEWKVWRAEASLHKQVLVDDDTRFARLAIDEAGRSVAEDGRTHPKVGVVVVVKGQVIATAHRGELLEGHAEFIALEKKLRDRPIAGATVYTTLEPCTTRNHPKIPCADRLVERKVHRVVIGMLDPNPAITGRGQRKLRSANIITDLFPHELMSEVEELNREFTRRFDSSTDIGAAGHEQA